MSKTVKSGLILLAITAVTGLILGTVQKITLGPILAQRTQQKKKALAATLPGAKNFTPLTLEADAGIISEVFAGSDGMHTLGYNFTLMPKGFGGLMTLICGINNEGRVMDITILESSETPGLGARASEPAFAGQFHGRLTNGNLQVIKTTARNDAQIQAISGATITSQAVTSAVNTARAYWKTHLKKEKAK